ncbi:hypothetical protein CK203_063518 [Vitis vinifera]|uniref:Uncharacterized protein n=1 Tax=Vitis vinifera TaxID=29760 RepID=A0A438G626_VITVI|nr:hypothetical protein CK203_063518 [Vitis vinifera]
MPKTQGDIPQLPRAVREPPLFHLGVLLQRSHTSEPGESSRAPRIHNLSLLPPGALDPARLLRATQIADPEHFMSRHILITLFCASRLSCGIHTTYLRASILFTIDGRQGILGARQIAEAFHIPYAPADPTAFRRWAPLSEWDMVRILSRGTSSQRTILGGASPRMLLVDVHSPELPEPREVPPAPSTSAPSEPVLEATSSDAPPAVPPTSEPPITIPSAEYPCLARFFPDSDHYSDGHYGADGPLLASAGPADSHSP